MDAARGYMERVRVDGARAPGRGAAAQVDAARGPRRGRVPAWRGLAACLGARRSGCAARRRVARRVVGRIVAGHLDSCWLVQGRAACCVRGASVTRAPCLRLACSAPPRSAARGRPCGACAPAARTPRQGRAARCVGIGRAPPASWGTRRKGCHACSCSRATSPLFRAAARSWCAAQGGSPRAERKRCRTIRPVSGQRWRPLAAPWLVPSTGLGFDGSLELLHCKAPPRRGGGAVRLPSASLSQDQPVAGSAERTNMP